MANSIHSKLGKKRAKRASVGITGMSQSPVSFNYIDKKEYTVEVPFSDDMHSILNIQPHELDSISGDSIRAANMIGVVNIGRQTAVIKLKIPEWTISSDAKDVKASSSTNVQWLLKPGATLLLPGTTIVSSKTVEKQAANGKLEYGYDGGLKNYENEKPMQYNPFQTVSAGGAKHYENTVQKVDVKALSTDSEGGFLWDDKEAAGANIEFGLGDGKTGLFNHAGISGGATALPHYTPGSIGVRFFDNGYSDFGLKKQTASTESGLAKNTKYGFKLTLDGGTQQEILFTTDSVDTTWGNSGNGTGVLSKINKAIRDLAPWKGANNHKLEAPQFVLGNGDIILKLTTAKHTSYTGTYGATAIVSAAPSTAGYITCLGVGSIPANLATRFQKPLFKELHRENEMMFDDGYGNLVIGGKQVGEIDYSTGFMFFKGAPKYSTFEFVACYDGALSGTNLETVYSDTERVNMLEGLHAASTNPMRKAKLKVCAYTI